MNWFQCCVDTRDGETSADSAPELSSPPLNSNDLQTTFSSTPVPAPTPAPEMKEFAGFDEFDPRGYITGMILLILSTDLIFCLKGKYYHKGQT